MSLEAEALELFEALADLSAEEQQERLSDLARQRPELGARVAALLRTEVSGSFLAGAAILHGVVKAAPGDLTGWQIGDFTVVERIGDGGQAEVYKAFNPVTSRHVALKVFHNTAPIDAEQLRPLHHANLHDPSIVTVYQAGTGVYGPDGAEVPLSWVAQQFVDAEHDVASHCAGLTTDQTLSVFVRISNAIAVVHKRGVLHCDLKPDNVLIDREGNPHVIDFDLAHRLAAYALSGEGEGLSYVQGGTPAYMAPERFGQAGHVRDVSWDIYALGVMLYECLVGERYIDEESKDLVFQGIRLGNTAGFRDLRRRVDPDVAAVVAKAVAADPMSRYAMVSDFVKDLERCCQRRAPSARVQWRPLFDLCSWVGRHPAIASMSLVVSLLLSLVSVVLGTDAFGVQSGREIKQQRALAPLLEKGFFAIGGGDAELAAACFDHCLELAPSDLYATIGRAQVLHAIAGSEAAARWLTARAEEADRSSHSELLWLMRERVLVGKPPSQAPEATAEHDVEFAALRAYVRAYTALEVLLSATPQQLVWIADHLAQARSNRFGHSFFDFQYAAAASRSRDSRHLASALRGLRVRWPENAVSRFYQGMVQFEQGETRAALVDFERAAAAGVEGLAVRVNRVHCLRALGRFKEAEEILGAEVADEDPILRAARAAVAFDRGQFEVAAGLYRQVTLAAPWFAEAWCSQGTALAKAGEFSAAAEVFADCLSRVPGHRRALEHLSGVRLSLGMRELSNGDLEQAVEWFEGAREVAPNSPLPLFQLGVTYAMQGQYDRAVASYRAALALDPNHADSHQNLIVLYAQVLGDLDSLRCQLHALRRVDPTNQKAHIGTLTILKTLGDEEGVLREHCRWLGLKAVDPRAASAEWLRAEGEELSGEKSLEACLEAEVEGIGPAPGATGCWRLRLVLSAWLRLGQRERARAVSDRLDRAMEGAPLPAYFRIQCRALIAEARAGD
ncbi:MAG: tetratricopeptide repeat protein [bacterium]|nr:tetratricopeptide repeat protein [bacterium]